MAYTLELANALFQGRSAVPNGVAAGCAAVGRADGRSRQL
jgi:hypothetical protein